VNQNEEPAWKQPEKKLRSRRATPLTQRGCPEKGVEKKTRRIKDIKNARLEPFPGRVRRAAKSRQNKEGRKRRGGKKQQKKLKIFFNFEKKQGTGWGPDHKNIWKKKDCHEPEKRPRSGVKDPIRNLKRVQGRLSEKKNGSQHRLHTTPSSGNWVSPLI